MQDETHEISAQMPESGTPRKAAHDVATPRVELASDARRDWMATANVGIADGLHNPVQQSLLRQGMALSTSCMADKQQVRLPESSCPFDVCPQCPYWAQQSLIMSLSPVLSRWCKGCQTEGLIYIRCGKGLWQE